MPFMEETKVLHSIEENIKCPRSGCLESRMPHSPETERAASTHSPLALE